MKSKSVQKGSRESAGLSAAEAFQSTPTLPLENSKANIAAEQDGRRRLSGAFLIDIDRVEPDPDQPRKRIDSERLSELTRSVKKHGILQPITVRYVEESDRYRIIAGECRFTAATQAGIEAIPCWVRTPKEEEILLHQVVENWQRSDLNPFELADSLSILRDANGFSQQQLAEQTGKSTGEISKLLTILDLDPDVQKIARSDTSGHMSRRHLYFLARLDPAAQQTMINRIQNEKLTALDVERYVARRLSQKKKNDNRSPTHVRRRFNTANANILFSFRKQSVSTEDLLDAIREVEQQVTALAAENEKLETSD